MAGRCSDVVVSANVSLTGDAAGGGRGMVGAFSAVRCGWSIGAGGTDIGAATMIGAAGTISGGTITFFTSTGRCIGVATATGVGTARGKGFGISGLGVSTCTLGTAGDFLCTAKTIADQQATNTAIHIK